MKNNKVLGAVCLHYGKEYLGAALASIRDHVDEIVIYYSARPSHGTSTHLPCPDTGKELRDIAAEYGCTWFEISGVHAENHHRIHYERYAKNKRYEQILVVDSDEIHISEQIPEMLEAANETGVRNVGIAGSRWVTLFRSFNEYVTDGFAPIRVINMRLPDGNVAIEKGFIYHMGYAIRDKLMEYKISCHGHRADFIKNSNWFRQKWAGYGPGVQYLHPATDAYWIDAQPFDKTTLPQVLKDHPYYNLDRIC